jgi:RNA polymerase sigma-54 factor
MLKQELGQRLQQKLTPQQIQMVKLLEIPTYQLEQKIKKELEENPVLQEGSEGDSEDIVKEEEDTLENIEREGNDKDDDDFNMDDYYQEDENDIPYYRLATNNYSKDEKKEEMPVAGGVSFHDFLENQLGLLEISEKQYRIGKYIIGNLDSDGYLRRGVSTMVDDLEFYEGINTSHKEVDEMLKVIQHLDPPGLGATDLKECLLIQINNKNPENEHIKLAQDILNDQYEAFTHKHYDKIKKQLDISDENLKGAIDEILKLNPKPGSVFVDYNSSFSQQIEPDFILENVDGELILSLNAKNQPELSLNKLYLKMLENKKRNKEKSVNRTDKEAVGFVKQKLNSAKWFIDAIKQRQNTLMLTMNAILEYQKDYFLDGEESKLKPMILKDIADRIGLDVSTVSRVVNSKYIQTHFGIFSLKYFFSEGMENQSGESVSTKEIKNIIRKQIDEEDKNKPLTDDKLADILKDMGYNIARRTVAKYREQMGVSVARLRKELN